MSAPTLRRLVHEPDLGMQFVSGVGNSHTVVILASTTELSHPGRYIVSGELVMTNGLWLADRAPADWVGEVAAAGAVGVAWGLDDESSEIPADLVVACVDADLSLLSVRPEVSFASIAGRVRMLTWGTAEHALRDQVVRGRQFAAVAPDFAAVLQELQRQTGLTGAILDSDAVVLVSSSERSFEDQVPALLQLSFSAALPVPLDGAVVFPVLPTSRERCAVLVIDADLRSISDEMFLILDLATMAAAVCDMRDAVIARHRAEEIELFIDLLGRGALGPEDCAERLRRLGLDPSEHVQVACVAGGPADLRAVRLLLPEAVLHHLSSSMLCVIMGPSSSASLERARRSGALGNDTRIGWGSAVAANPVELRRSLAEARLYLGAADRDAPTSEHGVTGRHSLLLSMLDRSVTDAFAEGVLGTVGRWDREKDGQLIATLACFFRSDCKVAEASRDLFIHPNTLRNRLSRIEELTGRSLESISDRVDLALALELYRAERAPG